MIAFVADVHLANHRRFGGVKKEGLNQRAWHIERALNVAVLRARAAKAEAFFVLGDLFDSPRPEPPLIAAAQAHLNLFGPDVYLITGNHDIASMQPDDNALVAVPGGLDIEVYDDPLNDPCVSTSEFDILPCCFRPASPGRWLPAVLDRNPWYHSASTHPRVLACHFGIFDDDSPPWAKESPGAIHVDSLAAICRRHGVSYVVSGDWHQRRIWQRDDVTIMQCGALVPTGFDNPGTEGYGTLALLDGHGLRFDVIPGPRFVTRDYPLAGNLELPPDCQPLYLRLHTPLELLEEAAQGWDMHDGRVIVEVVPVEEVKAGVETVAAPSTLMEALEETVNVAVPQGLRTSVLERCRHYLGV